MYLDYGSNKDDLIVFDVIVKSTDTKEAMIGAYETKAGITPVFPIILYNDGGNDFAKLFGKPGQGRPTWILHPTREFEETSYIEPTMSDDLAKAMSDSCFDINTDLQSSYSKLIDNDISFLKAEHNRLLIKSNVNSRSNILIYALNGKLVSEEKINLVIGDNKIILEQKISYGKYLLSINSENKKQFEKILTIEK